MSLITCVYTNSLMPLFVQIDIEIDGVKQPKIVNEIGWINSRMNVAFCIPGFGKISA